MNDEIVTLKDDLESYERIEASLVEKNSNLTAENIRIEKNLSSIQAILNQANHEIAQNKTQSDCIHKLMLNILL